MLYGSHIGEHGFINPWNIFWVISCFGSPLGLSLAQKVIEGCGARRNACGGYPREVGDPRVWLTWGLSPLNPSCCWYHRYEHFVCAHRDIPQGKSGGGGSREQEPPWLSPPRLCTLSRKWGLLKTVKVSWKPVGVEATWLSTAHFLVVFGTWSREPSLGT